MFKYGGVTAGIFVAVTLVYSMLMEKGQELFSILYILMYNSSNLRR